MKKLSIILIILLLLIGCNSAEIPEAPEEESSSEKEIALSFEPQPIAELDYIDYNENWQIIEEKTLQDVSGIKEITLYNFKQDDELRIILKDSKGYVDLDMMLEHETEEVTILASDVNNQADKELVVMVTRGAAYQETKIYDFAVSGWRNILSADNIIIVDMDNDGRPDLASTSMGSLPPYVLLYQWDGGQFLMADVTEDIGCQYTALSLTEEGQNIIQAGASDKYKLYEYYNGRLHELKN